MRLGKRNIIVGRKFSRYERKRRRDTRSVSCERLGYIYKPFKPFCRHTHILPRRLRSISEVKTPLHIPWPLHYLFYPISLPPQSHLRVGVFTTALMQSDFWAKVIWKRTGRKSTVERTPKTFGQIVCCNRSTRIVRFYWNYWKKKT